MATRVTMPKLGLTMTEGRIVEWRKQVGETVTKGDILYVIETEKVTFEVEAPESGILGWIVATEDEVVPVGGVVAYIIQPGEELTELAENQPEGTNMASIQEDLWEKLAQNNEPHYQENKNVI